MESLMEILFVLMTQIIISISEGHIGITYYRDEADSSTLSLDWRLVLQNLGDSAVGIRPLLEQYQ
jgi:hypothetical protein